MDSVAKDVAKTVAPIAAGAERPIVFKIGTVAFWAFPPTNPFTMPYVVTPTNNGSPIVRKNFFKLSLVPPQPSQGGGVGRSSNMPGTPACLSEMGGEFLRMDKEDGAIE